MAVSPPSPAHAAGRRALSHSQRAPDQCLTISSSLIHA